MDGLVISYCKDMVQVELELLVWTSNFVRIRCEELNHLQWWNYIYTSTVPEHKFEVLVLFCL